MTWAFQWGGCQVSCCWLEFPLQTGEAHRRKRGCWNPGRRQSFLHLLFQPSTTAAMECQDLEGRKHRTLTCLSCSLLRHLFELWQKHPTWTSLSLEGFCSHDQAFVCRPFWFGLEMGFPISLHTCPLISMEVLVPRYPLAAKIQGHSGSYVNAVVFP